MLDPAGFAEYLAGRAKWIALAVFAAVTAVGVVPITPAHPPGRGGRGRGRRRRGRAARATAGGRSCFTPRWRRPAIAVLADGRSNNIGWFAVCLLAGWCVLTGGRREGLAYWAAAMILFAAEWLWVQPDPGWGAWLAGVTLTVAFSLLVSHERDLLGAAARGPGRAGRAGQDAGAEPYRPGTARRHRPHPDRLPAACAERAAGRGARPGRRRARPGRGRTARPRVPGRGAHHGRDAPPGRPRRVPASTRAAAGRRRAARAGGAVPVRGRGRHPHRRGRYRRAARHHRAGPVPHRAGGPDERGQARARVADRGPADRRRRRGDADRGQPRPSRAPEPAGLGVVSMRERAESLGGNCEAGPGGRGWLVRATLPVDASLRAAGSDPGAAGR